MTNYQAADIVFESESKSFYAIRCPYGFEVYQNGHALAAHGAVRVARIGYKGAAGLERVKAEIARREAALTPCDTSPMLSTDQEVS